jgi:hypothetical protein
VDERGAGAADAPRGVAAKDLRVVAFVHGLGLAERCGAR